jgi:hypothetical protein
MKTVLFSWALACAAMSAVALAAGPAGYPLATIEHAPDLNDRVTLDVDTWREANVQNDRAQAVPRHFRTHGDIGGACTLAPGGRAADHDCYIPSPNTIGLLSTTKANLTGAYRPRRAGTSPPASGRSTPTTS